MFSKINELCVKFVFCHVTCVKETYSRKWLSSSCIITMHPKFCNTALSFGQMNWIVVSLNPASVTYIFIVIWTYLIHILKELNCIWTCCILAFAFTPKWEFYMTFSVIWHWVISIILIQLIQLPSDSIASIFNLFLVIQSFWFNGLLVMALDSQSRGNHSRV